MTNNRKTAEADPPPTDMIIRPGIMKKYFVFIPAVLAMVMLNISLHAQYFYPDDPISSDPDRITIEEPHHRSLSPVYDLLDNSFGSNGVGILQRAEGVNSLGEVPDSTWFTNRIGVREMPIEELLRGGNDSEGPIAPHVVTGADLRTGTRHLVVRDRRGDIYELVFDQKGFPNLATGAGAVSSRFFHAIGYHVLPSRITEVDFDSLTIDPSAQVYLPGGNKAPLDGEFLGLFKNLIEVDTTGLARALTRAVPAGKEIGPFRFSGTRPDDPNDIFPHENRRDLRGLRVFSAWLNHYLCLGPSTLDIYLTENKSSFVRHYLADFTTTLGSGYDTYGNIAPKNKQAGNEYTLPGDWNSILKTAFSFGIWERPWMNIPYPYPELSEIGRFEGEYFEPASWKTHYPNPAFERMLADDAYWAAKILMKFTDHQIREVVKAGEYSDPRAEEYLANTLISRRDKILEHYMLQLNPLDHFRVSDGRLGFRNLGEEVMAAEADSYLFSWFTFDNMTGERSPLGGEGRSAESSIPIPESSADYLLATIVTQSANAAGWGKRVEVFIRNKAAADKVVGIWREIGIRELDSPLAGLRPNK